MVEVVIIPYTLSETNLRIRKPGDKVNIELDIFAKYAIKALAGRDDDETKLLGLLDNY